MEEEKGEINDGGKKDNEKEAVLCRERNKVLESREGYKEETTK
jgi:hypothetical protein